MSEQLSVEDRWAEFKTEFNKTYDGPEEEAKRFEIFKDNLKRIDEHNKKYEAGDNTHTYKQGVNKFADFTQDEFADKMLMKPRGGGLLGSF